jgi:hypothetical protein
LGSPPPGLLAANWQGSRTKPRNTALGFALKPRPCTIRGGGVRFAKCHLRGPSHRMFKAGSGTHSLLASLAFRLTALAGEPAGPLTTKLLDLRRASIRMQPFPLA